MASSSPSEPLTPPPGPALVCRVMGKSGPVERIARVRRVYRNDVLALEACDDPDLSPRIFFAKEAVDWQKLTDWVLMAWSGGRMALPPGFRPLRRVSDELLERLKALPAEGRRKAIARMRETGFLPAALELAPATAPGGLSFSEIRERCLLAPGEKPLSRPKRQTARGKRPLSGQ